jgi:hypothetical protein
LTGLKLPAATLPPEEGGAAVALGDDVVGVEAFFVVEGVLAMVEWVDAGSALLDAFFLHDLRPSDARGRTSGSATGWGPRGFSWRRRMLAMWAPWPWEEASVRTTRARMRADVGSWKSMVKSGAEVQRGEEPGKEREWLRPS